MRFCPFCSAENGDEVATCSACGRRLPPLPPRRARNAPPTGVQLPPRATAPGSPPPPPPRKPATVPPPIASPVRDSAPSLPPPPNDETAQLTNVLNPAPAAQRREASPPEPREGGQRKTDVPEAAPRGLGNPLPHSPPAAHGFNDDFNTQAAAPIFDEDVESRTMPAQRQPPAEEAVTVPARSTLPSSPPPAMPPSAPRPIPSVTGRPSSPPPQPPPARPRSASIPPGQPSGEIVVPAPLPPAARPPLGAPRLPTSAAVLVEEPSHSAARMFSTPTGVEPPPTRIQAPMADRPFTPPKVLPIPEIPEPRLYASARYAVQFARARWQRRGAIKLLGVEIKQDTEALDQVLGALGKVARGAKIDGRVFSAENAAITAVEERIVKLGSEHDEMDARKADENSKFVDVERERNAKLGEAERLVDEAQRELANLEGQRRSHRDKRKELERRQKAYLKAAEDCDKQSSNAQMGDQRQEFRRSAEQHRREAAQLEPDRQEIDRRIAALEKPISEVTAKLDAAKAELDAAKRSLNDAREGHTHRLAELDAEQKRKTREVAQAEGEISRRLVTLGTLVNLNRIEDQQFAELYTRIDRLRGAITSRTTEIERLAAEREAFDRGTLVRGISAMGGTVVLFIAFIVILRAIL